MKPITKMAIWKFQEIVKKENRLEQLNAELSALVIRIPKTDMQEYIKLTEKLDR